jgi:hypothetical protein
MSDQTSNFLARIFFIAVMTLMFLYLFSVLPSHRAYIQKQKEKEAACVGHCPPPGPMDCTIYGRKKDGSWPSGFECSSTP